MATGMAAMQSSVVSGGIGNVVVTGGRGNVVVTGTTVVPLPHETVTTTTVATTTAAHILLIAPVQHTMTQNRDRADPTRALS
ncbi:MAG: hypothetical protein QF638_08965 [Acidimicrobiales bacterium]|nr:hypothetical protein [Acidimicrobiales bacterium]